MAEKNSFVSTGRSQPVGTAQPNANPLSFSVVIPTHNGRASIETAVKSILAQSWPHFELAVVADGDSGTTRAHLSSICDSRLSIFEQAPARSRGGTQSRHSRNS